jgi:hypothetical protein
VKHSSDDPSLDFEVDLNFREEACSLVHAAHSWINFHSLSPDCYRIPFEAVLHCYLCWWDYCERCQLVYLGGLWEALLEIHGFESDRQWQERQKVFAAEQRGPEPKQYVPQITPPNGKGSWRDKPFEEYMYDPEFLQVFPVPEIRFLLRIEHARRQSPHRFGVIRAALHEEPRTGNGSIDKTVYDLQDGKAFDKPRPTHWTDAPDPVPFEKIRELVDRVAEETAACDNKRFVRASAGAVGPLSQPGKELALSGLPRDRRKAEPVTDTKPEYKNHWDPEAWDGTPRDVDPKRMESLHKMFQEKYGKPKTTASTAPAKPTENPNWPKSWPAVRRKVWERSKSFSLRVLLGSVVAVAMATVRVEIDRAWHRYFDHGHDVSRQHW